MSENEKDRRYLPKPLTNFRYKKHNDSKHNPIKRNTKIIKVEIVRKKYNHNEWNPRLKILKRERIDDFDN